MLERLFQLKAHNTNVRTEILAGVTTFLAMAYILFVNPSILSQTGMDKVVANATKLGVGTYERYLSIALGLLLGGAIGYAFDGTARPLALALLASGLACLVLVLLSEKGKLFGPSDAEAGMGRD